MTKNLKFKGDLKWYKWFYGKKNVLFRFRFSKNKLCYICKAKIFFQNDHLAK